MHESHAHANKREHKSNRFNQIRTKPNVSTVGSSNWDKLANEVKSLVTIPSIIKGVGHKDDASELLYLCSIN